MKLSEDLTELMAQSDQGVSLREMLARIDHRSFGFLLVFLPLPTALPFTPPGFTIPFGLMLIVLTAQMLANRSTPWLPDRLLDRRLGKGKGKKMIQSLPKFLAQFEKIVRPRLAWMNTPLIQRLGALAVMLASVAMMVPFPVTNSICAIAIFLVGLGTIEDDGLATLAGYVLCFVSALVVGFLVAAPFVLGRQFLRMEF